MHRKTLYIWQAVLFLLVFLSAPCAQATTLSTKDFKSITILHEGRVKPIDSFARALKKQISGTDKHALPWLLETLFDPARAENTTIIKVNSKALIHTLDLPSRKNRLYNYREISEALAAHQNLLIDAYNTDDENLTQEQKNLLTLESHLQHLGDLLSSLSLYMPLTFDLPENTDIFPDNLQEENPLRFIDLMPYQHTIDETVKGIARDKGLNPENYNEDEQKLTVLSYMLAQFRARGERSILFKVIPDMNGGSYHAPWQNKLAGKSYPGSQSYIDQWQALVNSYHAQDYTTFQKMAKNLNGNASNKIKIETLYNTVSPFKVSFVLYLFALVSLLAAYLLPQFSKYLYIGGLTSIIISFTIHTIAIGVRMYILSRPPVSTLYESILFVSFISVLFSLFKYKAKRDTFWLWLAAGTGLLLGQLAFAHNQDKDSMMMLTAVLNTNFWLATHVTVITAGYAFCIITSILGHASLIQQTRGKFESATAIFKSTNYITLIALLLTTTGTILGGIWADQSWGRFWGWDPKENGALLIVLWLIWIIHGRIAKIFNPIWTSAGYAYLSVILAMSWFGVNLLSVGLHAYGFTDSAAWTLGGFTIVQTIALTLLVWYAAHSSKHKGEKHAI